MLEHAVKLKLLPIKSNFLLACVGNYVLNSGIVALIFLKFEDLLL